MSLKNRILIFGGGQCGCNIAEDFTKQGYNALGYNTSYKDIEGSKLKHKFHVAGAFGCNKDRKKALMYLKDSHKLVTREIDDKFPQQDIVYGVFSTDGGSGAGTMPPLLDLLIQQNPDKHFGAIITLPSLDQSLQSLINSIETYKQVTEIKGLKNLIVLDNNKRKDKFQINKEIVAMFDNMVNMAQYDSRGVVDEAEIEKIMTTPRSLYMGYFKDLNDNIEHQAHKSIFADFEKGTKYLALSLNKESNITNVEKDFGRPVDKFIGYNKDEKNFIVASGMNYPRNPMVKIIKKIEEIKEEIKEQKESSTLDISSVKFDINVEIENSSKPSHVDVNSIFDKYK